MPGTTTRKRADKQQANNRACEARRARRLEAAPGTRPSFPPRDSPLFDGTETKSDAALRCLPDQFVSSSSSQASHVSHGPDGEETPAQRTSRPAPELGVSARCGWVLTAGSSVRSDRAQLSVRRV
ncbi:unnamed protein product [Pleuronectes platessa]|uniref:Uncharacterized protein n=1 Tax=Pleuronectes platessa TaxID=8262 RepID=A0A9N7Z8H4_PLEPL|nr:unnamed protein product [Pleuronectes platessa]